MHLVAVYAFGNALGVLLLMRHVHVRVYFGAAGHGVRLRGRSQFVEWPVTSQAFILGALLRRCRRGRICGRRR